MDIQTAKQIKIADYLHSLGYSPVKQQGINLWYKSPFREETEASFKVNTEREQWYDFGLGKGGSIIELASHLYATDHIPYILERIAEQAPHIRPVSFSFGKQSSSEPRFQQLEMHSTHNGNGISPSPFQTYRAAMKCNRYFKGCIAPKEISHIRQPGNSEGNVLCVRGIHGLSFISYFEIGRTAA